MLPAVEIRRKRNVGLGYAPPLGPKQEHWFLLWSEGKIRRIFFPHIIKMMPHAFSRCTTGTIEKGMSSQLLFAILWPGFEGNQGIINYYSGNQMKSIMNTVRHFPNLSLSPHPSH